MLKQLLLLLLFFTFTHVNASNYDSNMTGTAIKSPDKTSSDQSCKIGYYLGNHKSGIMGIRLTFYSTKGIQLGNTIDVWSDHFKVGNYYLVETKEDDKKNKIFELYRTETNYIRGYPTRMDYINNGLTKFNVVGDNYYYYIDKKASGLDVNPLRVFKEGGVDALKEYFTTPEVVENYAKLALVNNDNLIDSGEYYIMLEPIVVAVACGAGKYGGVYTVSDFAYLISEVNDMKNVNNILLRCNVPDMLRLEKDFKFDNYEFKAVTAAKKCYAASEDYTPNEIFNDKLGVGMAMIIGTDVCKENCRPYKKYKIVYHTINLAHPFVTSKDGSTRILSNSSNWYGKEDTIKTDIYSNPPLLTVTLSPSDISKIREYNKSLIREYNKSLKGIKNYNCAKFKENFSNIFSNQNFC